GTTKYYGARIVVGEETWRQTRDRFLHRELDLVRVKGKEQAIRVFEPLDRSESAPQPLREAVERHGQGLQAYRAQDWETAERIFSVLHEAHPDEPIYRLYLERVAQLKAAPPAPDWDGVYERTTK
ncbi:MAG TPA: adenylate/guanylate cyclase domain-containing protein, partial [Gammaproteobacteria bacterium]|nr:adenylate/guanylate cyclase domain-containing protein [Gammaproteobacteria bacterium]